MGNRAPLNQAEKERIYQGKLDGHTLAEIAEVVGCSVETARKWWRQGRRYGQEGLRKKRSGRKAVGVLSQFSPLIAQKAEELKRQHHGWGADRVLIELGKDDQL